MSADQKLDTDIRTLDPNVAQRLASDPVRSICVDASAGTGKTKVLTDRVLRLLLPRNSGEPGTLAHRILCLTFTKAAASEMLARINNILSKWAVISDGELINNIESLTGAKASNEQVKAARKLFASVTDTPGGLKVMTIHSFCQSILSRFPLEAGLPPHFNVIDEPQAQDLLMRARNKVLAEARKSAASDLGKAFLAIAAQKNEEQFASLLRDLCSERLFLTKRIKSPEDLHQRLCSYFGISHELSLKELISGGCEDQSLNKNGLYDASHRLENGTKSDIERGQNIKFWLDLPGSEREQKLNEYIQLFLTKKGEIRKTLASKSLLSSTPEILDVLLEEAQRLSNLKERQKALLSANLTRDLITIGTKIIDEYQKVKEDTGVLDYDDLILHTLSLLADTSMAEWVLYKLDGGLDHILIDEAQDTNPEQWQIIQKLCDDFFSGLSTRDDITRTVFTVGDEKQSIYSFQRASPKEFDRMLDYFSSKAKAKRIKLDISFRSVQSILDLVDETFKPDSLRKGLGIDELKHHSFRLGQGGLIEMWPLFTPDSPPKEEPWAAPTKIIEAPSGQTKLAEHIGQTIKSWIESGDVISSMGRAVTPGDIMILVRTRTAFVSQIIRALKTRNIPVSGADRMVLGEQIPVMDLLSLAKFALLPEDDLNLACALKSPLIGLSEDDLFDICYNRKDSLWEALGKSKHEEVFNWLKEIMSFADHAAPFEFFSHLLQTPCPADKKSGLRAIIKRLGHDALDPLDELLNLALSFERDNIPALQGFVIWQEQGDVTIKREMEEQGQSVRIMTVHGSKGLQAPIVILPDTTRTSSSKKTPRFLWPSKTGLDVPLWSPRDSFDTEPYKKARMHAEEALDEEYRRLLYVAMTRAEDRLYIGGFQTKREPIEHSWYNYIDSALERMPNVSQCDQGIKRYKGQQTKEPDRLIHEQVKNDNTVLKCPQWLHKKAPAEPSPPRPLIPSRPSRPEPSVHSPLELSDEYRFRRGNITHKLLQILPELPDSQRKIAAKNYLAMPGHNISAAMQKSILDETMAILEHKDYSRLFSEDSFAEIPITGLINGKLISAQIDRMVLNTDSVWIVDYKTNRPPPKHEDHVPQIYYEQMSAYRDIVSKIYPDKQIETFLLWTDGPLFMRLKI